MAIDHTIPENEYEERLRRLDAKLWNTAAELKLIAIRDLKRIVLVFPEYTKHDFDHCRNILKTLSWLVPKDVKLNLTRFDLFLLLTSVYFHDIGMALDHDDIKQIQESEAFLNYKKRMPEDLGEEKLFQEYVRENHHALGEAIFLTRYGKIIRGRQIPQQVARLIRSHGLSLRATFFHSCRVRFFGQAGESTNILYLASCLRLGDYLDISEERVPEDRLVLPKDPISRDEWRKHLSISGVGPGYRKIYVDGKCDNHLVHIKLNKILQSIDKEIQQVQNFLANQPGELRDRFRIDFFGIENQIEPNGYELSELRIQLRSEQIIEILGEKVYSNPNSFIRELLQNSIDACRQEEALAKYENRPYEPRIEIYLNGCTFEIRDNGIGISKYVLENYLCNPGQSWYTSTDYFKHIPRECRIVPISQFGLGFLSCFPVSHKITIETATSKDDGLSVEIESPSEYLLLRRREGIPKGTKVQLGLRTNVSITKYDFEQFKNLILNILPFPPWEISIEVNNTIGKIPSNGRMQEIIQWLRNNRIKNRQQSLKETRNHEILLAILRLRDQRMRGGDYNVEIIASNGFAVSRSLFGFSMLEGLLGNYILAANFKAEDSLKTVIGREMLEESEENSALLGKISKFAEGKLISLLEGEAIIDEKGKPLYTYKNLKQYLKGWPYGYYKNFYKSIYQKFAFKVWLEGKPHLKTFKDLFFEKRALALPFPKYSKRAQELSLVLQGVYVVDLKTINFEKQTWLNNVSFNFLDILGGTLTRLKDEDIFLLVTNAVAFPKGSINYPVKLIILNLPGPESYMFLTEYSGSPKRRKKFRYWYYRNYLLFIDAGMVSHLIKTDYISIISFIGSYYRGLILTKELWKKIDDILVASVEHKTITEKDIGSIRAEIEAISDILFLPK